MVSERVTRLIERMKQVEGVEHAEVWETGGGCNGLAVILNDGRLIFGTNASHVDGERYDTDARLPTDDEDWFLGVYRDGEDGFGQAPLHATERATDDDFVVAVRMEVNRAE